MAMRIGELARRSGMRPSALRFYEEARLLKPAERSAAGYRLYAPDSLGRVAFIQRAQALGLSVKEIRELVESTSADPGSDRDRLRHVIAHKLAETSSRLEQLNALHRDLESLYVRMARVPGPGCGHLGDCGCWLPTEEEVMEMANEVKAVADCGCCECPEPGLDCGCGCCSAA